MGVVLGGKAMIRRISQRRELTREHYFFYFAIALVLLIATINVVADIVSR